MREYLKINESNALKAMLRNFAFNIAKKMTSGMLFAIGFFGTTILAVAISGTIKTWTTGEVLKSADLNTTIASLKTAIEGITSSQWTTTGANISYTAGNVGIGTASPTRPLTVITGTTRHNLTGGVLFTSALSATTGGVLLGSDNNVGYIAGVDGLGTTVGNLVLNQNGGNVGIGTAGPTAILNVTGNTVMTGYTSGQLHLSGTNGNQRMVLGYDTTNDYGFIQPVNISTGYKNLILNSIGGNVGIGTATPSEKLEVAGNIKIVSTATCTLGGGTGATSCTSDSRMKKDITPLKNSLEKINELKGVSFLWKKETSGDRHLGIIAQDVEKVFPELVTIDKDSGYKMVAHSLLIAPMIEAIKEVAFRLRSTSDSVSVVTQKIESLEKEKAANEKKLLALEEDNKRLRETVETLRVYVETHGRASLRLEDRLRAIENMQMARK